MTLRLIICLWLACGVAAFATHLLRRRMRHVHWLERLAMTLATMLLGPVALFAVICDDQTEI